MTIIVCVAAAVKKVTFATCGAVLPVAGLVTVARVTLQAGAEETGGPVGRRDLETYPMVAAAD